MKRPLFSICSLSLAVSLPHFVSNVANAQEVVVENVTSAAASPGNPDAQVLDVNYSDGMTVKVAIYNSSARSELPPIGILAGYGMDISYLHFMARILTANGTSVYLVKSPGQGREGMYSGLKGFNEGRDGYHNTIEGFATMYMDGLGQAMAQRFQRRMVLLGHSRGGYQVRFFLSGLRFTGFNKNGVPVLENSPRALQAAERNFLAVGSLFSPLRADPRLVEAAGQAAADLQKLEELDALSKRFMEEAPRRVGSAVGWITRLHPFGLLGGRFGRAAAEFNQTMFTNLVSDALEVERQHAERKFMDRFIEVITGQSDLTEQDFEVIAKARRFAGTGVIPSDRAIINDIERTRWMLGDADRMALIHTLKYASKRAPSRASAAEMRRISEADVGMAGWVAAGVDSRGKSISVLRALIRARQQESVLPYAVFAASGDGTDQATDLENRLLRAQIFKVDGSHAATLHRGAVGTVSNILSNVTEAKRFKTVIGVGARCADLFEM